MTERSTWSERIHREPQVVELQQSKEHGMDSGRWEQRAYA